MKISVLDLETTGLEQEKGHRIVEVAVMTFDTKEGTISRFDTRVNPRRLIEPKAMEVHGITDADVADAPYWEDVAGELIEFISGSDLLVAHNMDFDGPFLSGELERIGKPVPPIDTFCTMENARWATGTGKLPSLKELCFTCGIEYDDDLAHAAMYDVTRTMNCLLVGIKNGWFIIKKEGAS